MYTNYDDMSIYSGTWTLNRNGNDSCTLQQTSFGDYKIWFGTADGFTYDAD